MAYTLNTSHPLYANLIELIGVQGGALVSHKTARTFTKHADATYGSGAWGEHFTSVNGGYTAKGASFTPDIALNTATFPNYTVVAIFNATGTSSSGSSVTLARAAGGATVRSPGKNSSGALTGFRCTGSAVGTSQRMLTMVRIGETAAKMYLDNVLDFNGTGLVADYNDPGTIADYLLGWDGQAAMAASLVWLAIFNRELTATEIGDLYGSLGASNAFSLVGSAAASGSFAVTASDATFSGGGTVHPMASFTLTAAPAAFSGGASAGAATASFSITTAGAMLSGGATGSTTQGTLSTPPLKNNSGTLLTGETGISAFVYNVATGALVVAKTGLVTNGSGVVSITDPAILAGTTYRVVVVLSSGAEGMDKVTAA